MVKLSKQDKQRIADMKQDDDTLHFKDLSFQYEVEKPTPTEYRVAKYAMIVCLDVDYFETPEEVIWYVQGRRG